MRLVALLFWVAFLVWGAWNIKHRYNKPASLGAAPPVGGCLTLAQKKAMPHLIARRDMGTNWRVRRSDLYQPEGPSVPALIDFVGRYTACKLSAGNAVVSSELNPKPNIPVSNGKPLYLLPILSGEEESFNTGTHVDLFAGPTVAVPNAEVMAVICDSACVLVLQLTAAEIELLKLSDPLKLKKVIRK
jgi:hypothetical protein